MVLHEQAVRLAKEYRQKESELLEVLIAMRKEGCFAVLGYRGVFEYVTVALKLGEAQAYYFQKVVLKSIEVPALKEAVVSGEISLSQARRIVSVVTHDTSKEWIAKASTLNQKQLELAVAEKNPHAKVKERLTLVGPKLIQMVVALTPETEALLRRVKELESQRTKSAASWNDVICQMAEVFLKKNDPVQRAQRVSLRTAKPRSMPKPGRKPIAADVKHEVTLRDGHQCTDSGPDGLRCQQRQWLELDHVVPVARGGLNTANNLRTRCAFHHRMRHVKDS